MSANYTAALCRSSINTENFVLFIGRSTRCLSQNVFFNSEVTVAYCQSYKTNVYDVSFLFFFENTCGFVLRRSHSGEQIYRAHHFAWSLRCGKRSVIFGYYGFIWSAIHVRRSFVQFLSGNLIIFSATTQKLQTKKINGLLFSVLLPSCSYFSVLAELVYRTLRVFFDWCCCTLCVWIRFAAACVTLALRLLELVQIITDEYYSSFIEGSKCLPPEPENGLALWMMIVIRICRQPNRSRKWKLHRFIGKERVQRRLQFQCKRKTKLHRSGFNLWNHTNPFAVALKIQRKWKENSYSYMFY